MPKDPTDPKPKTAYVVFLQERTEHLKQQQPELKDGSERNKAAIAEWKDPPAALASRKRELQEQQKSRTDEEAEAATVSRAWPRGICHPCQPGRHA